MKHGVLENIWLKNIKNKANKTKIEICLNNEMELYNRFSILDGEDVIKNENIKINNEIVDYIIMETEKIPKKNAVVINIKILNKTNDKIKIIEKLLKENINEKTMKIINQIKILNRNAWILLCIGLLLIGITQIFNISEKRYSINEFIIVMSWVFMWKAVEIFFFERIKLVKEKLKLLKIYYSEII